MTCSMALQACASGAAGPGGRQLLSQGPSPRLGMLQRGPPQQAVDVVWILCLLYLVYWHQLGRYFSARDSLCKDASSKLPISSSWSAGALLPAESWLAPLLQVSTTFSPGQHIQWPSSHSAATECIQALPVPAATFLEAATQKPGFRPALQLSCLLQVSNFFSPARSEQEEAGRNKYLTEQNAQRLADALCRMRGAALKLGQMLSIQDEGMLPPQVIGCSELSHVSFDCQQGL